MNKIYYKLLLLQEKIQKKFKKMFGFNMRNLSDSPLA